MITRTRIIKEWLETTDQIIEALTEWRRKLAQWERAGCDNGEFHAALWMLRSAGLEAWADRNKAGGGLDALAAAVTGEEM